MRLRGRKNEKLKRERKKKKKTCPSHSPSACTCFILEALSFLTSGLNKKKRGKGGAFLSRLLFFSYFFLLQYGVRDIAGRFAKGERARRRSLSLGEKKAAIQFFFFEAEREIALEMTLSLHFCTRLDDPLRAFTCSPVRAQRHKRV